MCPAVKCDLLLTFCVSTSESWSWSCVWYLLCSGTSPKHCAGYFITLLGSCCFFFWWLIEQWLCGWPKLWFIHIFIGGPNRSVIVLDSCWWSCDCLNSLYFTHNNLYFCLFMNSCIVLAAIRMWHCCHWEHRTHDLCNNFFYSSILWQWSRSGFLK